MIPDKIYVREYPDGISRFWGIKRKDDVVATIQHEYIRKDALMEWLKERYNSTISNVGCYTGHSVWCEVIEKLESL